MFCSSRPKKKASSGRPMVPHTHRRAAGSKHAKSVYSEKGRSAKKLKHQASKAFCCMVRCSKHQPNKKHGLLVRVDQRSTHTHGRPTHLTTDHAQQYSSSRKCSRVDTRKLCVRAEVSILWLNRSLEFVRKEKGEQRRGYTQKIPAGGLLSTAPARRARR